MDEATTRILAEIRKEIHRLEAFKRVQSPLSRLTALVMEGQLTAANAGAIFGIWLRGETPALPELVPNPNRGWHPDHWATAQNEILAESWLGKAKGLKISNPIIENRFQTLRQALCEVGPLRWLTAMVAGGKILPNYAGRTLDKFIRGMGEGLSFTLQDYRGESLTTAQLDAAVESILQWSEIAQGVKDPKWELWARSRSGSILEDQSPAGVESPGVTQTLTEFIESLRVGVENGTLSNEQSTTKTLTGIGKEATEATIKAGVKVGAKTASKPRPRFAPMSEPDSAGNTLPVGKTAGGPHPKSWVAEDDFGGVSAKKAETPQKASGSKPIEWSVPAEKKEAATGAVASPKEAVKSAAQDANSWKENLTAVAVKDALDGTGGTGDRFSKLVVAQLERDIAQMIRQIPRLAPGREVTFEEFRRFIRWAIGNNLAPLSIKSFITSLHIAGMLSEKTVREAGEISDLRTTDAGGWLRNFGKPALPNIFEELEKLLPSNVKIIREPAQLATALGGQSLEEATELLTMLVSDGALRAEFASAALDAVAENQTRRDSIRKQIVSGMKNASAFNPKATEQADEMLNKALANLTTMVIHAQHEATRRNKSAANSFEQDVHDAAQALEEVRDGEGYVGIEAENIAHLSIDLEVFERTYAAIIKEHAAISGRDTIFASAKEAFARVVVDEDLRVAKVMSGEKLLNVPVKGFEGHKHATSDFTGDFLTRIDALEKKMASLTESEGIMAEEEDDSDILAEELAEEAAEEAEEQRHQLWLNKGLSALATQVVTGNERSVKTAAAKLDSMVRQRRLMPDAIRDEKGENLQTFDLSGLSLAQSKFEDAYRAIRHHSPLSVRWTFPDPTEAFANLSAAEKVQTIENQAVLMEATAIAHCSPKEASRYLAERVVMGDMHTAFAAKVLEAQSTINDRLRAIEKAIHQTSQEHGVHHDLGGNTQQEGSKKMSKSQIAKATVLDDMKEIALRTSVKRTRAILATKVAEFWAKRSVQRVAGESEEDFLARAERNREGVAAFLLSDAGQGALAYMVGFAWPMLEDQIPDVAVKEYGAMVAREIRIQGGTDILDSFIMEVVVPLGGVLKDEAVKFTSGLGSGEKTRVVTDTLTAGNENKAEQIAALKRQLAALAGDDHSDVPGAVNGKTAAFGQ